MSRLTDLARRLRRRLRDDRPTPPAARPVVGPPPTDAELVRAYHARTKHHLGRYARALGYMDWDTQPDPFRRWRGAPLVPLDLVPPGPPPVPYEAAFVHGRLAPRPLDRASLSQLFMDALALSAWKQAGEARWSLRVDPSSGNLHPTEGWLIAPPVPGLSQVAAVYHYAPFLHALERRRVLEDEEWASLSAGLPDDTVLVGLSSIWWRESWKYGERAFRYCQHDLGHCLGTVAIAAAGLGWRARLLEGQGDEALARLLGLGDWPGDMPVEARDIPEALIAVGPAPVEARGVTVPDSLAAGFEGLPSALSTSHHAWPVIEEVEAATRKAGPAPAALYDAVRVDSGLVVGEAPLDLRTLVHQRRSAVSLDGRTGITRAAFEQILRKLLPGPEQVPWTTLPWAPRVHLALFVHRVEGVVPGLYLLLRDPAAEDRIRPCLEPELGWERDGALPLFRLREGDCRALAQRLSCGQDIASDGVFAVAMLAELRDSLDSWGPWAWKRLHWEAGLIGQVLYLEAEASGIRGTGIGCFFDDPTHQVLLSAQAWREDRLVDLYHFTLGGPVEDSRLQTLPAYAHRDAALAEELGGADRSGG